MEDQARELRELMMHQGSKKKTKIIAIASGKGGVGKTNISVNLGIAYSKIGKKVIVMDADLGLANVNILLNILPQFNLYHVIHKKKSMKEIILDTPFGIQIVAGASGFFKIANLTQEQREGFINEMHTLSEADIIIVDTAAGISDNVLDFLAAADYSIIITTPEPTSITDAYGIIKTVATEIDNLDMGLGLIVNRVESARAGSAVADRIIKIASQFLNLKVNYLGCVYEDPLVPASVLKQKPFFAINSKSKASISLSNVVSRLEKSEMPKEKGLGQFIKRLFGSE